MNLNLTAYVSASLKLLSTHVTSTSFEFWISWISPYTSFNFFSFVTLCNHMSKLIILMIMFIFLYCWLFGSSLVYNLFFFFHFCRLLVWSIRVVVAYNGSSFIVEDVVEAVIVLRMHAPWDKVKSLSNNNNICNGISKLFDNSFR